MLLTTLTAASYCSKSHCDPAFLLHSVGHENVLDFPVDELKISTQLEIIAKLNTDTETMSIFREGNLFAIKTTSHKTLVRKKKQAELCIIAA